MDIASSQVVFHTIPSLFIIHLLCSLTPCRRCNHPEWTTAAPPILVSSCPDACPPPQSPRRTHPSSVSCGPRERLQQVRCESVSQVACVGREVLAHLLQLVLQLPRRPLVPTVLARRKPLPLLRAAHHRPHQEVAHIGRHRLRQCVELGRICPYRRLFAVGRQRQNV